MQIRTRDGNVVLLSADAEIGLREAAALDSRILSTVAELGAIEIQNDTEDAFVPLGRAFFDSNGCGPYDTDDL